MGEYAALIWGAYATGLLVLAALAWVSWRGLKRAQRRLSAMERE